MTLDQFSIGLTHISQYPSRYARFGGL
jgi:hypothetical protein